jgi:hypothetical protein
VPSHEDVPNLRSSASHEAGHVLLCLRTEGARLGFARAATIGRGTSKLLNPKDLPERTAAKIAVAGRVAEEVLLGVPARPLPDNDNYLLVWALDRLGPAVTEEEIRAELKGEFEADRAALRRIADELFAHPDQDVPADRLAAVVPTTRTAGDR